MKLARAFPFPGLSALRTAARRLRRSPGYTLTVAGVLALTIGAVTAIFSVVYGVLLQPYGFEQRGKLVVWHETVREVSAMTPELPVNYKHFQNIATHARSLESAAILEPESYAVISGDGHPEVLPGLAVSPEFFRVLGQEPALGRAFQPDEFTHGRDHKAVLSWAAFEHYAHGDRSMLGNQIRVDGAPVTVVGVLPREFRFPSISIMAGQIAGNARAYGLYMPFVPNENALTENDGDFNYFGLARLRPGISIASAQAELDGLETAEAAEAHLPLHFGAIVEPFAREITGGVSRSLVLLLAAVGGVLLVGCVNLANLQLARSLGQAGEQALRAALGASRGVLVRETLAENVLLALFGGMGSLVVAYAGIHALLLCAPAQLPRLDQVRLNLPVLLAAGVLALFTSVLFGALPAWRAGQADPMQALGSTRSTSEPRSAARTRAALLTAEIACSLMLLAVTGTVARSFGSLLSSARGLASVPVTMAQADLSDPRYQQDRPFSGDPSDAPSRARSSMIERTLTKLQALPGVRSAALTSMLPLTGDMSVDGVTRPDHPLPEGQTPLANLRMISPGYFAALSIPILTGREFNPADQGRAHVAIVSASTARAAWPGENPVGHTLKHWNTVYTVVGVAADARLNDPRRDVPMFYLPFWEYPPFSPVFLVRGSGIAGPEVRKAIWSVDPEVAIPELLPLRVETSRALAVERFQTLLVGSFAAAALLLAALGVYGVLSYGVNLRMREWGVRMALGSSRGQLMRKVLLTAARPAGVGALLGGLGSLAAGRALAAMLYGAPLTGLPVLGASLALLAAAVLLAALLPARRAAQAEPAAILRGE